MAGHVLVGGLALEEARARRRRSGGCRRRPGPRRSPRRPACRRSSTRAGRSPRPAPRCASASLRSSRLRSCGVVCCQVWNAASAAFDGPIDVLGAARLDVGDDLAVGRVLDGERLARGAVDPGAVDELLVGLDALEGVGHGEGLRVLMGGHRGAVGGPDRHVAGRAPLCIAASNESRVAERQIEPHRRQARLRYAGPPRRLRWEPCSGVRAALLGRVDEGDHQGHGRIEHRPAKPVLAELVGRAGPDVESRLGEDRDRAAPWAGAPGRSTVSGASPSTTAWPAARSASMAATMTRSGVACASQNTPPPVWFRYLRGSVVVAGDGVHARHRGPSRRRRLAPIGRLRQRQPDFPGEGPRLEPQPRLGVADEHVGQRDPRGGPVAGAIPRPRASRAATAVAPSRTRAARPRRPGRRTAGRGWPAARRDRRRAGSRRRAPAAGPAALLSLALWRRNIGVRP